MPTHLAQLRRQAAARQFNLCFYCDCPMWDEDCTAFVARNKVKLRHVERFKCTAEHLIARQDGGLNVEGNIVAACKFCNGRRHRPKKALSPFRYRAWVQKRMQRGIWHPPYAFTLSLRRILDRFSRCANWSKAQLRASEERP